MLQVMPSPSAGPSLRLRKKLATRRALRRAALDLVVEHGYAHVTIEDIAAAADVSPRTFFNYFPSKEAAVLGEDPERDEALRQELIARPAGEPPTDALRHVLRAQASHLAREVDEIAGSPAEWVKRYQALRRDRELSAAHAAHMASIERLVGEALAERLEVDARRDPYPALLASSALGAMRVAFVFWAMSGGTAVLADLVEAAFSTLALGLPEDNPLRDAVRAITQPGLPDPASPSDAHRPLEVQR